MAMSGSGFAAAVQAALTALESNYENLPNDHELSGFEMNAYNNAYWTAVGTAIVEYMNANAKATGTDSGGDSHNLDIV